MEARFERYHPGMDALHHGFGSEPCFVCSMVQGEIRFREYPFYEVG